MEIVSSRRDSYSSSWKKYTGVSTFFVKMKNGNEFECSIKSTQVPMCEPFFLVYRLNPLTQITEEKHYNWDGYYCEPKYATPFLGDGDGERRVVKIMFE